MEPQDHQHSPVTTSAARGMSAAAMDLLTIVSTNLAAIGAALVADLEAVAISLGLASAPVPARRLVLAEVRRRPRGARPSTRIP